MSDVNLRERRLSLEIVMPIAAMAALVLGAVVASAEPAPPLRAPARVTPPPPLEMEGEEIVAQVVADPEPMVISSRPKPRPVEAEPLGTSTLKLDVPEGATVYLGKKKLGQAPLPPTEIIEGRYLIRVALDDTELAEWVDVPPGATFTYRLSIGD